MSKFSLKVTSWNLCNGLLNKMDYVKAALHEQKIDIMFLQETEIQTVVDRSSLSIKGYNVEMARTEQTVRLIAYIREDILYNRLLEKEDSNVILLKLSSKFENKQVIWYLQAIQNDWWGE